MTQTAVSAPAARVKGFVLRYFLIFVVVFLAVVFGILKPEFFAYTNLLNILGSTCISGIMAVGMTFVMITGEIDFGASTELSLGGCLVALMMNVMMKVSPGPTGYLVAVVTAILGNMILAGVLNSLIHVKIGVPSFIGTMAVSTFLSGVLNYMTGGIIITNMAWPDSFRFLGQKYIGGVVPVMAVVLVVVVALAWLVTEQTAFGMKLRAIGMNPVTSRHVGINVQKFKVIAFLACAGIVAFAGIVQVSQLNSADPYLGDSTIITCLSACMLGATFYRIGEFNVLGSALAALMLSEISNGITMLGVPLFWRNVIQGLMLLVSIGTVSYIRKRHKG